MKGKRFLGFLLISLMGLRAGTAAMWSLQEPLPAGSFPRGVAAGDVTGDGAANLVVANFGSQTFIGQTVDQAGQETFGSTVQLFTPSSSGLVLMDSIQTGASNRGVAILPAQGEDESRIFVTAYDRNQLMVFRVHQGKLQKIQEAPVPAQPVGVTVARRTLESPIEVAVACFGADRLVVFPLDDNGRLQVEARSEVAVGDGPTQVIAADFEQDGEKEFWVASLLAQRVDRVRRENGAWVSEAALTFEPGCSPAALAAADFDADGLLDLTGVCFASNQVFAAFQKPEGGLGAPVFGALSGEHPNGLCAADFNRDGASEIVVAVRDSDQVELWRANDGALTRIETLKTAEDDDTRLGPVEAAVLDADQDGDLDFVVSHMRTGTLRVFHQEGDAVSSTPTPAPEGDLPLVAEVKAGPSVSDGKKPIRFFFTLGKPAKVELSIYTLDGTRIFTTTVEGHQGENQLLWQARNQARQAVASGLYLYDLEIRFADGTLERRRGKIAIVR